MNSRSFRRNDEVLLHISLFTFRTNDCCPVLKRDCPLIDTALKHDLRRILQRIFVFLRKSIKQYLKNFIKFISVVVLDVSILCSFSSFSVCLCFFKLWLPFVFIPSPVTVVPINLSRRSGICWSCLSVWSTCTFPCHCLMHLTFVPLLIRCKTPPNGFSRSTSAFLSSIDYLLSA